MVHELIAQTKVVFLKTPKRFKNFTVSRYTQPILARWATWLQTAFNYFEHFQQKNYFLECNPKEPAVI